MTLLISFSKEDHFYIEADGHEDPDGDLIFLLRRKELAPLMEWVSEHGISGVNLKNSERVTPYDTCGLASVKDKGKLYIAFIMFNQYPQ